VTPTDPPTDPPGHDGVTATITYVGHSTVAVEVAGTRILTDPVLTSRLKHLRRVAPPVDGLDPSVDAFDPSVVDVVVISHQHHDHFHVASLERLPRTAHAVVPPGLGRRTSKLGFAEVTELAVGETTVAGSVTVTAVPAVHDDRRHPGAARVRPVGFTFEHDGWSCYFAGDTDLFEEMADLDPEVALLPVWGWGPTLGSGHLDPRRAADALALLDASVAIPIHWGTLWPYHVRRNDRLTRPPEEFREAARRLGLEARVIVVQPGGSITV
jgi:L-ascorbate metabolism protein UlaG (beta-lactamase superfamily)